MLYKSTEHGRGEKKHYHIVYLRPDNTGVTSKNAGHTHDIIWRESQIEVRDNDPNSAFYGEIVQEAREAGFEMTGGHEHEWFEYELEEVKQPKKSEEIVKDLSQKFFDAEKREEESIKEGREAEDIYSSKHWDADKKKKLEKKSRAAVTINKIEEKIDNLTGYQRQNRTDIKFLPMENGDEAVCDMLNPLVKNILERTAFGREESKVFEDSSITGRGLFNIYEDFEKNFQGDIKVEKFKWDDVRFGEHDKEDLEDCEILFKEKWYSIDRLKEMYPDKTDKLEQETRERSGGKTEVAEDWDKRLRSSEFINNTTKKYRVIECQNKVFKRVYVLVNAEDDFVHNAEGWKDADVNMAKTIPGFHKVPRVTYNLRVSKFTAYCVLLEDEILEDEDEFSIVPVYAKYRNSEFWGKIRGVMDLQYLINKAYSQFVDIINKVANYGYFYDDQTFPDKKAEQNFLENASSPGAVHRVTDINRRPVKEEGVKFPSELVNAISVFNEDLRQIMGINLSMVGQSQGESGIAIRQKIVQQLVGNDFLFDNLSYAKKKIGQILLKKIKKRYTPERILRTIANVHVREGGQPMQGQGGAPQPPQPAVQPGQSGAPQAPPMPMGAQEPQGVIIAGIPMDQWDQDALIRILEEADLTQNDVIVSESSSSPSAMMGNFLALLEMAGRGVAIPPEAIVQYAPIPDKRKVMAAIASSQQAAAAAEDKKYETEILKTQIAHQGKQAGGGAPPAGQAPLGPAGVV